MPQLDVVEQLRQRFEQPLGDYEQRRIVIWHDAPGEFSETFGKLVEEGFGNAGELPRPVRFLEAADGVMFNVKRTIYRDDTEDDILLYRQQLRGKLEGDWLADVELYAEHFQADYLSLLIDELGLADTEEVRAALRDLKAFCNAKDRRGKFAAMSQGASTRDAVEACALAVLVGSEAPTVEDIVPALLMKLAEDPERTLVTQAGKLGLLEVLARFLERKLGYKGSPDSEDFAQDLAAYLLVTAASCTITDVSVLHGLDHYLVPEYGTFCLTVVRAWMAAGADAKNQLREFCMLTEERCGLAPRFTQAGMSALLSCDVFPSIDAAIIKQFMEALTASLDRADEALAAITQRRAMTWYDEYTSFYAALAAAAELQRFYRAHATEGFHIAVARDVWKAYLEDWHLCDTRYRAFSQAFEQCKTLANPQLDDAVKTLAESMDALYANWFLKGGNTCWINAAHEAWAANGRIEGIARQTRFYDDVVVPELSKSKRVVVAVSDALRYEVAAELANALERDTKGTARLEAMQAVFPTITKFGMAALLPHYTLALDADKGTVLVDGMPCSTTTEREAVLQARNAKSRAVQFDELMSMKGAQRKELATEAEVIYVYHNAIDRIGDDAATEHDVFDACEDAIDDLTALVKVSVNDLGCSHVLITADHGFLYTNTPLKEMDHVAQADFEGDAVLLGRRYAVVFGEAASDVMLPVSMDAIDGGPFTGLVPRECLRIKRPGAGENYVHGGMTLQEAVVPIVRFHNLRSSSKSFVETTKAQIELLTQNRRITNNLFSLDFFQKQPVAGKVAPCVYELVLTDASGNEVSDIREVHADLTSANEQDRKIHVSFSLKAGRVFDENAQHFLVVRDKSTGRIEWKSDFKISIAFGMVDDFGF